MTCSWHVPLAEESRPHARRAVAAAALLTLSACRLGDLVSPAPPLAQLAVSPTNVVDSASAGSVVARTANLTVANAGPGALSWVVATAHGSTWLTLGSTRGTGPDSVTVTLSPAGLLVGTYTDTLIVTSDLAATSVSVPVEFAIVPSGTASSGTLTVTTSTTGSNLPSGYTVTVDGGAGQAIGISGSVTFTTLAAGSHSVALTNVAGNCTVSGSNPQTVTVPSGGTATAGFTVSCTASTGTLTVTTSTTGSSQPSGYTVAVDGGAQSQPIGTAGSVTFTNLAAGSHSVALTNVAGNCTVSGSNPQTVTVTSGGTATTTFSVSCTTPSGNLTVTTSTSGSSVPSGYTVTVDGSQSQPVGINGSVTFTTLAVGSHSVALTNVAGNCTVSGSNPQTVTVPSGGTATTTFSINCTTPPGTLTVTTTTSGSSLPSGYTVTVDGGQSQPVGINSTVTFTNLVAGSHSVALTNVAGNCTVSGSNPQTVTVPSGGTATTPFSINCTTPPGNLTVTMSTTGSSLPSGYTVTVDGGQSQSVGVNGSVTFTSLAAGSHNVALTNVASNCTVSSTNPQTVTVPSGGTATTTFSINCTTPPGSLTVTTSTSGSSQPSGYTVTVDGSQSQAIGVSGSVTFTNLSAGSHSVTLTNVASNCTVSSTNPQTVSVPSGGTATTAFSVSCVRPPTPPVVNAGTNETVVLGVLYNETGTFTDAGSDGPWSYTIDWGDGSTTSGSTASQGSISATHTYLVLGSYTITVTVQDSHGDSGSGSKVLTVIT